MADLLILTAAGPENASRAILPFFLARAAKEKGKDVAIVLAADAALLATPGIRDGLTAIGFPPLRELYGYARSSGIPVHL